jgi:hypothetical protein
VVAGRRRPGLVVEGSVASERWTAVAPPRCRSEERAALSCGSSEGWGPAWLLAGGVAVGVGPREIEILYFENNSHAKILKNSGWLAGTGEKAKILQLAWASGKGVCLALDLVFLN